MAMVTPDTGYAFGGDRFSYGVRLTTYNGGKTWRADSVHNKVIKSVCFLDRHNGIATGQDCYFLITHDAGNTWLFKDPWNWIYAQKVAFSDTQHGIVVGGESYHLGRMATYDGFGNQTSFDSVKHELTDVVFTNQNTAVAVGYGVVLRSTDAGKHWTELPVTGDNYRAVCFPTRNTGYIVGLSGSILKSTDEGQNWSKLQEAASLGINGALRDVEFIDENTGFICGDAGLFWTTTNGGKTWKFVADLPKVDFNAIHIKGKNVWILGNKGTIIKFNL